MSASTTMVNQGGGDRINDVFQALPKEKQNRILDAGFEEFAVHGYRHASTNRIAEGAGIAKGMLFYYFGSKEALYQDLIGQALDYVEQAVLLGTWRQSRADFIALCGQISRAKAKALADRPALFHFLSSLVLRPDEMEAHPAHARRMQALKEEVYHPLYEAIERTPLRSDVPKVLSAKYIRWMLSGYEAELTSRFLEKGLRGIDLAPYWAEFDEFLTHIRTIFCE